MSDFTIAHILFLFLVFMFIGWVHESTVESLYHRKIINRGFLRGPYIPVYGFGGMVMLVVCLPFKHNPALVFLSGMIACTALEYITGSLVERILKKQLWDYSMMKFVYKNRISLISSIFWGILSLFQVYVLSGILFGIMARLNMKFIISLNSMVYIIFAIDLLIQISEYINFEELVSKLNYDQLKLLVEKKYEELGHRFPKLHRLTGVDLAGISEKETEYDSHDEKDKSEEI